MAVVSPLRYPGGKSKLIPFFKEVVKANGIKTFVEPFAGGAGVSLALLLDGDVEQIALNEFDRGVYAFWWSVLYESDKLISLIENAVFTIEEWNKQKEIQKTKGSNPDLLELGFSTFYLNRVNRSGIVSAGVIGGLKQDGNYKMNARFNKRNLISKIKKITEKSDYIRLSMFDAADFIKNQKHPYNYTDTLFFIDPPYYEKGHQLYPSSYKKEDHEDLANALNDIKCFSPKYVVTYDNHQEINKLHQNEKKLLFYLNYSVTSPIKKAEPMFYSGNLAIDKNCLDLLNIAPEFLRA